MLTTPGVFYDHSELVLTGSSEEEHEVGTYPIGNNTGLLGSGFRAADHNVSELMMDQFITMRNLLSLPQAARRSCRPTFLQGDVNMFFTLLSHY